MILTANPDILLLLLIAMAPPLGLHPIDQIVNVQWGDGLAVEFFDKAGPPKE